MKRAELKPCALCGKGVMHTGLPLFYRAKIERMGVDVRAVQRQVGLEQIIGSPAIAQAMGLDEDLAKPLGGATEVLLCEHCAGEPTDFVLPRLVEISGARADA